MKFIPETHRPLDRYSCWWTISLQRYHLPSSQWIDTDIVYQIYLLLKFTVPKYYNYYSKLGYPPLDIGDLRLFCPM